jgi:hypothetical protein
MTYLCAVSGQAIPPERVEALIVLGVPESQWTKKEYSQTKKLKLYMRVMMAVMTS